MLLPEQEKGGKQSYRRFRLPSSWISPCVPFSAKNQLPSSWISPRVPVLCAKIQLYISCHHRIIHRSAPAETDHARVFDSFDHELAPLKRPNAFVTSKHDSVAFPGTGTSRFAAVFVAAVTLLLLLLFLPFRFTLFRKRRCREEETITWQVIFVYDA
jgi:hypothetical protein